MPSEQNGIGKNDESKRLLVFVLALWPVLAATWVLAFGECKGTVTESLVYRSLGHLILFTAMLVCALVAVREPARQRIVLPVSMWFLVGLFLFAFIYSSLLVAEPNYFLVSRASLVVINLFFIGMCVTAFSRWPGDALKDLWPAIFISMLLYLPVLPYIIFFLPTGPEIHWSSCFAPVQNVRWFAALLAIAIAAGISLPWHAPMNLSPRSWYLPVGLFTLWTLLFWSGSRGQVLGLGCALFALFILSKDLRPRLLVHTTTTAIPGLVCSAFLPIPSGSFGFLQRVLVEKGVGKPINEITSHRSDIWVATIEAITERPLLGYGPGQLYPVLGDQIGPHFHTHNFPLEAVFSYGFIGGGALIVSILAIYLTQIQRARRLSFPEQFAPPFLIFTTILIMSLFSGGVLFKTISAYLIIAGCGMWAASNKPQGD